MNGHTSFLTKEGEHSVIPAIVMITSQGLSFMEKNHVDTEVSKLINCVHIGLFQLSDNRKTISSLTRSPQGKRQSMAHDLTLLGEFNVQECCSGDSGKRLNFFWVKLAY